MLTLHKQVLSDRQEHSVNTKNKLIEKLPPLAAAGLSCPGTAGWSDQPDRAKFWWSVWPWLRQDLASPRNALLTSKERTVRSSGNTWKNHFCGKFIYEKQELMGNDPQFLRPAWTVTTAHCKLTKYNPHEDSVLQAGQMTEDMRNPAGQPDAAGFCDWIVQVLHITACISLLIQTVCCMCCVLSYSTYKPLWCINLLKSVQDCNVRQVWHIAA